MGLMRETLRPVAGLAALHIPEDKRPIPRAAQGATTVSTRVPLLVGRVEVFLQAVATNTALLKGRDDVNEVAHGRVCP
jgi:hypothetical protein